MKQQQLQKTLELLGADKLNAETQGKIKNNITSLVNKTGDHDILMFELLKNLGANRLDENVQSDLIKRIDEVINFISKSDNISTELQPFINKLNDRKQVRAKDIFNKLISESGPPAESHGMHLLVSALEGSNLNEGQQNDLRASLALIVEFERQKGKIPVNMFKWNSLSESAQVSEDKIKISDFIWKRAPMHGDPVALLGENIKKKIDKNSFRKSRFGTGFGSL